MLKKNSNKKNSAADELLSSLLDDVDQFEASSDDKLELEPTVYGSREKNQIEKNKKTEDDEVASDFLMPGFDAEKSAVSLGLSQTSAENVAMDDFWEQAEKMASKPLDPKLLNQSLGHKDLDRKIPQFKGPEASSDFLDQMSAQLSPVHKSGVVNTNSETGSSPSSYDSKSRSNYDNTKPEGRDSLFIQGINFSSGLLKEINGKQPEYNELTVPLSSLDGNDTPQMLGQGTDVDRTIAVTQFAQKQNQIRNQSDAEPPKNLPFDSSESDSEDRIVLITQQRGPKVNSSQISIDASLAQAENLRMAQNRILDLEREVERLRQENDEIIGASEILRAKADDYAAKISIVEKEAKENFTDFKNEIAILKGNLSFKENENQHLKNKVDELELRIKTDFRKIRIRERELENRLELVKAEKQAVSKSKDELLLELQRKNDQAKSEIDNYREKVQELNKSLESNHSQIKMTVRALRIALSHIEDKSDPSLTIKKAN